MSSDRHVNGARREYERVADSLRHEIEDGAIAVGEQLPTHAELVERFQVSRATIQKALKELEGEGYVESAQGKGVFALDWRMSPPAHANGVARRVDSASVELDDAIAKAFEAEHVTIDAYCLTSESLNGAIVPQVRRILRRELRPSSVRVRLLLPRPDVRLAIPQNVDDPDDPRPLRRLAELIDVHTHALRNLLENVPSLDVEVEVRTVPITPVVKFYLLNGQQALTGYYRVELNDISLPDGDGVRIYDVLGLGAQLYRQGPAQLNECRQWFDSLWSMIAEAV